MVVYLLVERKAQTNLLLVDIYWVQPVKEVDDRTRPTHSTWGEWGGDLTVLEDFVRMKKIFLIIPPPPHPENLAVDYEWSLEKFADSIPGLVVKLQGYLDSQDIS